MFSFFYKHLEKKKIKDKKKRIWFYFKSLKKERKFDPF